MKLHVACVHLRGGIKNLILLKFQFSLDWFWKNWILFRDRKFVFFKLNVNPVERNPRCGSDVEFIWICKWIIRDTVDFHFKRWSLFVVSLYVYLWPRSVKSNVKGMVLPHLQCILMACLRYCKPVLVQVDKKLGNGVLRTINCFCRSFNSKWLFSCIIIVRTDSWIHRCK